MISSITNNLGFGISKYYEDNRNLTICVSNYFGEDCISSFEYQNDALGRRSQRIGRYTASAYESLLLGAKAPLVSSSDANYANSIAITNSFAYNHYSEVTNAIMNTNDYNFTMDDIGNRTEHVINDIEATYDDEGGNLNQYIEIYCDDRAYDRSLKYDLDGNMTNVTTFTIPRVTWRYTWNGENRMTSATNTTDGTYVTYKYDYQGRMISKNTSHGGTETRREFVWMGNHIIAEMTASTTNYYCWSNGETLTANLNGETIFYCHDANKNVTDLVDDSGTHLVHYDYSPFGVQSSTVYSSPALVSLNPFRFSNEYFDETTGLVEYKYRPYFPPLGKFASLDPIGEAGGFNLYGTCNNDLLNKVDWWGLSEDAEWIPPALNSFFSFEKEAAYNVNDYLEIKVLCVKAASKTETTLAFMGAGLEYLSGGFLSVASRSGLYGNKKLEEIKPERKRVNCNCGRLKVVILPKLGIPKEIRDRTKAPLTDIQLPLGSEIDIDDLWGAGTLTDGTKDSVYPNIIYANAKFNVGLFMGHKYKDIDGWTTVEKRKMLRTWNTRLVGVKDRINYLPYYNRHDRLSSGDEVSIQIGSIGVKPKVNYILEIQ